METHVSEDAALKVLTKQIENLEKLLEAEMSSHNSAAVKALQQQLDKLQGEYNTMVYQMIMGLPAMPMAYHDEAGNTSIVQPVVVTENPPSPVRPGKKRKRAASPVNSATKLFRPTLPEAPTNETEETSTNLQPAFVESTNFVSELVPQEDVQPPLSQEHKISPAAESPVQQTENGPALHFESIVPDYIRKEREEQAEALRVESKEEKEEKEKEKEELTNMEELPMREATVLPTPVTTETSQEALQPLRLEISELRVTIERLSQALGVSEESVAEAQLRLRDAEAKYKKLELELEKEKKEKEDFSKTLQEMAAAQEEVISSMTVDKQQVEQRLLEITAELRSEKESAERTRQELSGRGQHLGGLQEELDAVRRQLSLVQGANSDLVAAQKGYEEELKRLKEVQEETQSKLAEVPVQEMALKREIEEQARKIAEQAEELSQLKGEGVKHIANIEQECRERLQAAQKREEELQELLKSLQKEKEELKGLAEELAKQKEALGVELASIKQQAVEIVNHREALEKQVNSLTSENESLRAEASKMREEGEKISEEAQRLRAGIKALEERDTLCAEFESKYAEAEKLNASLVKEGERLKADILEKEHIISENAKSIALLSQLAEEKEGENKELMAKLDEQTDIARQKSSESEQAKSTVEKLQQEKEAFELRIATLEKANKNLMHKLQESESERMRLGEENAKFNELGHSQEEKVLVAQTEAAELKKKVVALEEEMKQNRHRLSTLQEEKEKTEKKARELVAEAEERRATNEKLQAQLEHMKEDEQRNSSLLGKQKGELEEVAKELEGYKQKEAGLQGEKFELERELKETKKALKNSEKENKDLQERASDVEEKQKEHTEKIEKLTEEIEQMNQKHAEAHKNWKSKLAKERNDAASLRGEVEKLMKEKESTSDLQNEVKKKDEQIAALEAKLLEKKKKWQAKLAQHANGQKGSSEEGKSSQKLIQDSEEATPPSQKGRGAKRGREEEKKPAITTTETKRRRKDEATEKETEKDTKQTEKDTDEEQEEKHQTQEPSVVKDEEKSTTSKRKAETVQSPSKTATSPSAKKLKSPSGLRVGSKQETAKPVTVYFSGFKDEAGSKYTMAFKNELAATVSRLGGNVRLDAEFDAKITHVVTPPNCRTMKTLAAALTSRWLVSPEWVVESGNQGKFVDESLFGVKYTERPFEHKVFYISKNFEKENAKGKDYKVKNAHTLATSLGKGIIVKEGGSNIDYTLVGKEIDPSDTYGKPITWNEFVNLIPGTGKTIEKAPSPAPSKGVRFTVPEGEKTDTAKQPSDKRSPSTRGRK